MRRRSYKDCRNASGRKPIPPYEKLRSSDRAGPGDMILTIANGQRVAVIV